MKQFRFLIPKNVGVGAKDKAGLSTSLSHQASSSFLLFDLRTLEVMQISQCRPVLVCLLLSRVRGWQEVARAETPRHLNPPLLDLCRDGVAAGEGVYETQTHILRCTRMHTPASLKAVLSPKQLEGKIPGSKMSTQ